jgi:hypothetical protein
VSDLVDRAPQTSENEAPRTLEEVAFRSIRDRDLTDQRAAIDRGYASVEQLAIDELGLAYHRLTERVDKLEGILTAKDESKLARAT